MAKLTQLYERVAVISLAERSERREQLLRNLMSCKLISSPADIFWIDAVDGRQQDVPKWWRQGPGAWGCRQSQVKVVESARRDHLDSVLILEDDACFHSRSAQWLDEIDPLVPSDWDMFYLGGEHKQAPSQTNHSKIIQCNGTVRTHAYAVHHRIFDSLVDFVTDDSSYQAHPTWHVDHQYSHLHKMGIWRAYAPSWWFAGQESGQSDIGKQAYPRRWWQQGKHYWKLPIVLTPEVLDTPESNYLFYSTEPPPSEPIQIAIWLRRIALDAWECGKLPACLKQSIPYNSITKYWPAGIVNYDCENAIHLSKLADYPANGLFTHPYFFSDYQLH